jgi:shikimate dehydrogenase
VSTLGRLSINGSTRLIGIVGDPVAHSLSPALHNVAFAHLGLNMAYVPLPVPASRLPEAVAGLRALGFLGANVTVPHKTAVVPLLDELRGDAQTLRAVNTVVAEGERLVGFNTDVEGFTRAFLEAVPQGHAGGTALLMGAGGAARAAALGALRLGFSRLLLVNRTPAAAEALAALLSELSGGMSCEVVPLHDLSAVHVRAAALVINATTLGMHGQSKVPGALADNVGVDQIVYDLVYAEGPTELTVRAREQGSRVVDGLAMLVHQAGAAFQLWTGMPAPLDIMKHVLTG